MPEIGKPQSHLDDFANALAAQNLTPGPLDPAAIATGALSFFFENLQSYSDEQLGVIHDHLIAEIVDRGLDEEILGETQDAASISLDDEMNEMIKLVKRMRSNLSKQTATGKSVSNREIRETLAACVTTMKQLVSHQKAVRTLERQRIMEAVLIEILGEQNPQAQDEFLSRFRERLEEVSA